MEIAVFVNSIQKRDSGHVVIEASNGGPEGPPFVRFSVAKHEAMDIAIGTRYTLKITKH